MRTLNFNFNPQWGFLIGAIIVLCFIAFSCNAPDPPPQPIDREALRDSSNKAFIDSLNALDTISPKATNIATQMNIESHFDKIN